MNNPYNDHHDIEDMFNFKQSFTHTIKSFKMNILLASVKCLPKLINGKVAVINKDGTYTLYKPSRYTTISDDYNPMNYSILVHPKYKKCIVESNRKEQEHYLVNKQVKELKQKSCHYRIGDKIHIHSRQGIYEIVGIDGDYIKITCRMWQYDANPIHIIHANDFKCLAGGLHNFSHC